MEYSTAGWFGRIITRDIHLYDEVHPDSLRVDLGWGARWIGWKTQPISGTAAQLKYDFSETDQVAALLRDHDVPAYWSYCYTPTPLQPRSGDFKGVPTDEKAWADVLRTMAVHYKNFPGGNPVGYHEVGNEPDNRDFFTGGMDAYLRLYALGSRAIRDGDADAMVGGPALAFSSGWVDPFLDSVLRDNLPLDFYSFHYYPGVPYATADLDGVIRQMRESLQNHPELRTTEMHLNEWNPYKIDYPRGGRQDRFAMASDFLHDVKHLLDQPWLTRVYFAQFQDSGGGNFSGMIDIDGTRKAVFNAYAMYQSMPTDRVRLDTDDSALEGFASADSSTSEVLLWNRSNEPHHVLIKVDHSPGKLKRGRRIDHDHNSPGDGTGDTPSDIDRPAVAGENNWEGDMPGHGVMNLIWSRTNGENDRSIKEKPVGRIVRELHDYPDRSSRCYAAFDRRIWTAWLGMGGEEHATARVGATIDGLADDVKLAAKITGTIRPTATIAARIDFQSHSGAYTTSVLYSLTDAGKTDAPVWGTARPADSFKKLSDNSVTPLDLKQHAPADWTGRVQISFVLKDAGLDARVTFRLLKP